MELKKKILSLTSLSIYSILNCMIYLWVFWGFFNVQIMDFISINDLLPSVAITIAAPAFIYIIYVFTINKIISKNSEKIKKHLTHKIPKTKIKTSPVSIGLAIAFIPICYNLFHAPALTLKFIFFVVLSFFIIELLVKNEHFSMEFGTYSRQLRIIIGSTPMLMFISAAFNATTILEDKTPSIVESNSPCLKKNVDYIYIGTVSDKAFAYSKNDKSICIFKFDYLKIKKRGNEADNEPTLVIPSRA